MKFYRAAGLDLPISEIWILPFISTVTVIRAKSGNKGAYMVLSGMAFFLSFLITPFLGTYVVSQFGFNALW